MTAINETGKSNSTGGSQEKAATVLSSSPPTKPTNNIVTPEAAKIKQPKSPTKILQPTKNPVKLSANFPNKVYTVTPTKAVSEPPTKQSTVFTNKTNSTTTKPPKKPPDPKCNNHAGVQRVAGGAADVKPGPTRNKVKWKGVTPIQRVSGAPIIKPPKKLLIRNTTKIPELSGRPEARRISGRASNAKRLSGRARRLLRGCRAGRATTNRTIRHEFRGCRVGSNGGETTMIRERVC